MASRGRKRRVAGAVSAPAPASAALAPSAAGWQVYWPEDFEPGAAAAAVLARYAIIGFETGPRRLLVAALVPWPPSSTEVDDVRRRLQRLAERRGPTQPRPRLLGEWLAGDDAGAARATGPPPPVEDAKDETAWLTMAQAAAAGGGGDCQPFIRSLYVRAGAVPVEQQEGLATSVAVVLYRRPHPRPCRLARPRGDAGQPTTELEQTLQLMARALALQNVLDGSATTSSGRQASPGASGQPSRGPRPAPPPPFVVRYSLACTHLGGRLAAWRRFVKAGGRADEAGEKEASRAFYTQLLADGLLGAALGLLLWRHAEAAAGLVGEWEPYLLRPDSLRRDVAWLNSHPGGFKLNVPLTQRLGAVALLVADLHQAALDLLLPLVPPAAAATGWAGPGRLVVMVLRGLALAGLAGLGATTVLAAAFDLQRALGCHLPLLFATFARLHRVELGVLASLWRLFRGKKRNVLRRRVDSCEYDTQQLLLGTLLFTVAVALFPTLAAFYAFFAGLHLAGLAALAALWLAFVLARDWPTYLLAVRLAAPARLTDPASVSCQLVEACRRVEGATGGEERVAAGAAGAAAAAAAPGDQQQQRPSRRSRRQSAARGASEAEDEQQQQQHQQGWRRVHLSPSQSLLRLRHGRVPLGSLFGAYRDTARALIRACPSLAQALGMLLTGSLVPARDGSGDGEEGDGSGRGQLAFLLYKSLPQTLVEVAAATALGRSM